MPPDDTTQRWSGQLNEMLPSPRSLFQHLTILEETESTQTAAVQLSVPSGSVVIALRQTKGIGRFNRQWIDTNHLGLAVTFVIDPAQFSPLEQLALAVAVGTARAIESVANQPAGIKWPNDIIINDRKVAGILIDIKDNLAYVGIGINVAQQDWPEDLKDKAISLFQVGVEIDRLDMMKALLIHLDDALSLECDALTDQFLQRDILIGTTASFQHENTIITGNVLHIDPLHGLAIQLEDHTQCWLPAATTTMHIHKSQHP